MTHTFSSSTIGRVIFLGNFGLGWARLGGGNKSWLHVRDKLGRIKLANV